jgi:hypothetical protein
MMKKLLKIIEEAREANSTLEKYQNPPSIKYDRIFNVIFWTLILNLSVYVVLTELLIMFGDNL